MIVAIMPVYNRIATVRVCLPAWARHKGEMFLWVHDDGSTDAGMGDLLRQHADRVTTHEHSGGGAWGIAKRIRDAIRDALVEFPEATWIYICDSDTYPTAGWFRRVSSMILTGVPRDAVSFFNSSHHQLRNPITIRAGKVGGVDCIERPWSPGCSFMMRASRLRTMGWPYGIVRDRHDEQGGAWDFVLSGHLGPVLVTKMSLVEHLGAGGLHSEDSWEVDRALQPATDLQRLRSRLIKRIEEDGGLAYHPRNYWANRFHVQGPTYVASSRDGSASQADAFLRVIEPFLAPGLCVLDYGCGTGRLASRISHCVQFYRGVDINAPALAHARTAYPRLQFLEIERDGSIPIDGADVDMVVACTVLQHVPESIIAATCAEIRRVLSPRGRVVLVEDANPEGQQPAAHMAYRSAERYAELLGLRITRAPAVFDAERPGSHWVAEFGE